MTRGIHGKKGNARIEWKERWVGGDWQRCVLDPGNEVRRERDESATAMSAREKGSEGSVDE